MLRSMKLMEGFHLSAADGDAGMVADLFIDDGRWTVRYLLIDGGGRLARKHVLIPPHAVERVEWSAGCVHVRLSRRQLEDSPPVNADAISRDDEQRLLDYLAYPYYWSGPFTWGASAYPGPADVWPPSDPLLLPRYPRLAGETQRDGSRLHGASDLIGSDIEARDGRIGHASDFMFDDTDWSLIVLVVDTDVRWPGRHVLLSLDLVDRVSWPGRILFVDTSFSFIEHSPEFSAGAPPRP